MTSNAIAVPDDRSYPKAREISTSKRMASSDPNSFSSTATVSDSLFPNPNLTAAEQREADETTHIEFFAVINKFHPRTVDLAVFRV